MKVLFLNPPFKTEYGRFSRTSRSPAITKSGTIYYPIWLCYTAGIVENDGFQIKIIDSCAYEYDRGKTWDLIREYQPDSCVLDTSTPSIYNDVEVGAGIKEFLPDCFVVLMGTHPTALPDETLKLNPKIDAVVVGEADYTIRELVRTLEKTDPSKVHMDTSFRESLLGRIDGLAFRSGDRIFINRLRELIKNLDKLPFVSQVYKRHLDPKRYFFGPSDYPEVQIITARGCIARCTFCVYPQTVHGLKYRMRSAKSIADEFQWIVNNMSEVREIGIEDDTFTGSQRRVIEFCKELIKRNIRIKWYCNVRVDLKYETMEWMKKAGCVLVTAGYESASREVLKNIDKKITPEMTLEFSRNTKRAGLLVHGCFMAGNRGETRKTLKESLELSLKLMDDTMQFFPLMAYPGTKDYEWAKENGLLTINGYNEYVTPTGLHNSVLRMPDMTSREIVEWCDYARRKYYLRPRYILYKLFQQLTTTSEWRRTFKMSKQFFRFLYQGSFGMKKERDSSLLKAVDR